MSEKIFIIAGEASGDMHASGLCKELVRRIPNVTITGIGGPAMADAGVDLLFPNSRLAVVGLFEVLSHAGPIFRAYRQVVSWLKRHRPGLLILVDYPEFNLLVASKAKKIGIPVFYFISPQIWAWREGRIKKIRRLVDRMAVILPFEKKFYSRHGMDVTFVGHPLVDRVKPGTDRTTFCRRHGIDHRLPLVGLLPGSRSGEIRRFFKIMIETGRLVKNSVPTAQFVIPVAPGVSQDLLKFMEQEIRDTLPAWDRDIFRIVQNETYDAIAASDIILTASGTVTLEAGILGTPMIVMYKVSPLTYHLGRHLIKVKYCSLVNLVAGREIVPEIFQYEANPERLSSELVQRLKDPERLAESRQQLLSLRNMLGHGGAAARAAGEAISLMRRPGL